MKICYNPRVMIRALAVSFALLVSPVALAADATTSTGGAAVVTSSADAPAQASGMRPGVAPPPKSKHPYFFAAYAAVWAGIFGYALWLGARISSLEQKVTSVTDGSR